MGFESMIPMMSSMMGGGAKNQQARAQQPDSSLARLQALQAIIQNDATAKQPLGDWARAQQTQAQPMQPVQPLQTTAVVPPANPYGVPAASQDPFTRLRRLGGY